MELIVVGSSSSGNCYAMKAKDGQLLILEAGCPLLQLKKAINFSVSNIVGVLVTHEHGDHASRIGEYAKEMRCPFLMSKGTHEELLTNHHTWLIKKDSFDRSQVVEHGEIVHLGNFKCMALALRNSKGEPTHDAAEPMCYIIEHPEMGKVLFCTDTYLMPYRPQDLTAVMIECNYTADMLEENFRNGIIDPKRRKRTVVSHMSLENCKKTLSKMNLTTCRKVILVHISHENGAARRFCDEVMQSIAKPVFVAAAGEKINLNRNSF